MAIDSKFTQAFKAYMDACDIHDEQSYEDARTGCISYVLHDFPRYSAAYKAYMRWSGNGRNALATTDEIKLGNAVHLIMGRIASTFKPSVNGVEHHKTHDVAKRGTTMHQLYTSWLEIDNFVPKDKCLAHFLNLDPSTFSRYRNQLINAGYKIESVKDGWLVKSRPAKVEIVAKTPDFTPEELVLLDKLLKKLRN